MPVMGTVGHVDHGKSTLIKAITGRDPDRWEEEKVRGVTIDLGFAWTTLSDGTEVSFVDVPGHRRFVRNMLAGIESVDVALFVVDVLEGWMPQSEEHLAILDMLGITHGVVALTKIDQADRDLVDLAEIEVRERLQGTSLETAEVVPVSAIDGRGLEPLLDAMARAVRRLPGASAIDDSYRLWVDRVFTISGAGVVVTGTLLNGCLSTGSEIWVWPGNKQARVRELQVHEATVQVARPGARVAVNLKRVNREDLARGSMLGRPGSWFPTRRFAAQLSVARYVDQLLPRADYQLHIGSGVWPAKVRSDGDLAFIQTSEPVAIRMGDRFILRDTGRRLVVGGGRIVVPDPPSRSKLSKAQWDGLLNSLSAGPDARAEALLSVRGRTTLERLKSQSGGGSRPKEAVVLSRAIVTRGYSDGLIDQLRLMVDDYHEEHPLRLGIPLSEVAERLAIQPSDVALLCESRDDLLVSSAAVQRSDFSVAPSGDDNAAWEQARATLDRIGPDEVPRIAELGLDNEMLHILVRSGELIRISAEFVYRPAHVRSLMHAVVTLGDKFSIRDFKARTGLSRKYSVPFLQYTDEVGLTARFGDLRTATRKGQALVLGVTNDID